jgi:hypothetical protein
MSWYNPFSWGKGSRSSEASSQSSASTPVATGSNQRVSQQSASGIGHRQSPPLVVPVQQPKPLVPNVASTSTPVSRPPLGPTPTAPTPQVYPKPQSVNPDTVNLTKVELEDFKRKLESVALNMAKVAAESERVSRSNEQWVLNFSDRQKVLDVTAKLTIENDKVKLLEAKVRDSGEEIKNYQDTLEKQAAKINSLIEDVAALTFKLGTVTSERDEISRSKATTDAALVAMEILKISVEGEKLEAVERGKVLESDLSATHTSLESKVAELNALVTGINSRLAQFTPQGILESKLAAEVAAFDSAAASGDPPSLRVMAGLAQLRAGFIPGSGPDDKLVAVKSIGAALYTAWSAQSKDAKAIHLLFADWQNFLNDIPGAGYQLVVPDLGQSVPQNVTPLDGASKVNEVLLWIVKGSTGAIYAKGIVR